MSSFINPARFTGALAIVGLSSLASAATLVDYKPLPVSPATPEFTFAGGGGAFAAGPGATGNADGTLPLAAQTPGGLEAETPFIIPGIPGSQLTATSTIFFDSTLVLNGLVANNPAVPPPFAGGPIIQPLGAGNFSLFSTDPDGAGPLLPTLLLSGNILAPSFIAGVGSAGGEFNSNGVVYTGGVIFNAMTAGGALAAGNSMSISMTDITQPLAIGGNGFLNPFTANGTGLFTYEPAVPEPGSVMLAGGLLAGAVGVRRSRRS